MATATRSARARPLKHDSEIWWSLVPYNVSTCSVTPAFIANDPTTTLRDLRFTAETIEHAKERASKEAKPLLQNCTLDTTVSELPYFKGKGCDQCGGSGEVHSADGPHVLLGQTVTHSCGRCGGRGGHRAYHSRCGGTGWAACEGCGGKRRVSRRRARRLRRRLGL